MVGLGTSTSSHARLTLLSPNQIDRFIGDGFIVVRGAAEVDVVRGCRATIDAALREHGIEPDDASTWTTPVVRLPCPEGPSFATAGTSRELCSAYDALLGAGAWHRREGVGERSALASQASSIPATRAGISTAATTLVGRGGSTSAAAVEVSSRFSCSATSVISTLRPSCSWDRISMCRTRSWRLAMKACRSAKSRSSSPRQRSTAR
jgi:hypothetical protein